MEKVCTALWREPSSSPSEVEAWVSSSLLPHVRNADGVRGATVHVETRDEALSQLRHGHGQDGQLLTALVSVWADTYHASEHVRALAAQAPASSVASYLVCESVPQPYGDAMTWAEGQASPGLSIVTLLDKPDGVTDEVFYRYWHELHRITTAECHPFKSYVRNEVSRPLTTDAPRYRGIVTESSPDVADFLDPHRFFVSGGDAERLRANRRRVTEETTAFIDFSTIQVVPMQEHVLRRLAPTSP